MANQWFRLYSDTLNNPKVQTLSGDEFKAWVNILCVTSQCDGKETSRDNLAFYLRMSRDEINVIIDALIEKKLLLEREGVIPCNWDSRQFKSDTSAERTRKYRERKAKDANKKDKTKGKESNVSCDVTVTPPESDTDTDTDKEIKKKLKEKRRVFSPPTQTQVIEYSVLKKLDCTGFFDYYESNGWMVGKNKMKNWQAALNGWSKRQINFSGSSGQSKPSQEREEFKRVPSQDFIDENPSADETVLQGDYRRVAT